MPDGVILLAHRDIRLTDYALKKEYYIAAGNAQAVPAAIGQPYISANPEHACQIEDERDVEKHTCNVTESPESDVADEAIVSPIEDRMLRSGGRLSGQRRDKLRRARKRGMRGARKEADRVAKEYEASTQQDG